MRRRGMEAQGKGWRREVPWVEFMAESIRDWRLRSAERLPARAVAVHNIRRGTLRIRLRAP